MAITDKTIEEKKIHQKTKLLTGRKILGWVLDGGNQSSKEANRRGKESSLTKIDWCCINVSMECDSRLGKHPLMGH